ncbi:hypothetical protein OSTOST_09942 [Ostertagia ostertagi]
MLPTVYENEDSFQDPDEQLWIEQYYNSSHESDDEFCSEFDFSGIGYNAFRLPDSAESHHYGQETIDEQSELVLPTHDNREDNSRTAILNHGQPDERIYTVAEYNDILVQIMNPILTDILADQNKTILYHKLSDSANFQAYIDHARNLQNVRLKEASPDEKLAFFINVYNMMTIHMIYLQGPPRTIWDRRKLTNCTYYQIDDHKYAPHSILDGILRSNRKGLEMLWKPFGKKDARLPNVRKELRDIASDALESESNMRVDTSRRILYFSKLFQWYAMDFGCTINKIIEWILWVMEESDSQKKKNLEMLYRSAHYEVEYIPYDWSFNGKMKE